MVELVGPDTITARLPEIEISIFECHSIRINDQYRVCLRWTEAGAEDVEIVDYH